MYLYVGWSICRSVSLSHCVVLSRSLALSLSPHSLSLSLLQGCLRCPPCFDASTRRQSKRSSTGRCVPCGVPVMCCDRGVACAVTVLCCGHVLTARCGCHRTTTVPPSIPLTVPPTVPTTVSTTVPTTEPPTVPSTVPPTEPSTVPPTVPTVLPPPTTVAPLTARLRHQDTHHTTTVPPTVPPPPSHATIVAPLTTRLRHQDPHGEQCLPLRIESCIRLLSVVGWILEDHESDSLRDRWRSHMIQVRLCAVTVCCDGVL